MANSEGILEPDDQQNLANAVYWKPWTVTFSEVDLSFHGLPNEDKRPHLVSTMCDCNPAYKGMRTNYIGEDFPYFKHNSYDLREIDEWYYYNIQHPEMGQTDKDMIE